MSLLEAFEEVAQAQVASEDNDDTEEVASNEVRVGGSLPTLASDSKLPLQPQVLRQVIVLVQEDMLPQSLSTYGSPAWKDGSSLIQRLKEILPHGKKGKASRQIPMCLILDAKDLTELLVVVNYWLHMDVTERQRAYMSLQRVYERPSSSNDRVQGAGFAIGVCDAPELLAENAQKSAAAKAAKRSKTRNQDSEIEHPRHLVAKPVRSKFALVEKHVNDLMRMTVHQLSSVYEVCLVLKRNVATPQKGKTSASDICLPYSKTLVIARNEAKLRVVFGDAYVDGLKLDEHVKFWYFDEKEETYSDFVASKRKADKIQTSEETRQQPDHRSSVITPDDL